MDKSKAPLITIGVVSCNRFYYLRALLESAKLCVTYPNVQWIVVDNASVEPGLVDYLKTQTFIDSLILREERSPKSEHPEALNIITEQAKGEYIIILSDDVQFIRKNWEWDIINILNKYQEVTSVSLSALRKVTLERYFKGITYERFKHIAYDIKHRRVVRAQRSFKTDKGEIFRSFGYMREPIDGVGMLIASRTFLWKELGPWKTNAAASDSIDSSAGGEADMLKRAIAYKVKGHMVTPIEPVIATIVTDSEGLNARVRNNTRFGKYLPPHGNLYYEINDKLETHTDFPFSFESAVAPIKFELPLDKAGNLIKGSVNFTIANEIE
jgi:hypothetical protein